MTQYIDKDAVVEEIERRRKEIPKNETDKILKTVYGNEAFVLTGLLSFLDTLEVKEVDLDKEVERFVKSDEFQKACGTIKVTNLLAKHFFELGLKAQKGK